MARCPHNPWDDPSCSLCRHEGRGSFAPISPPAEIAIDTNRYGVVLSLRHPYGGGSSLLVSVSDGPEKEFVASRVHGWLRDLVAGRAVLVDRHDATVRAGGPPGEVRS